MRWVAIPIFSAPIVIGWFAHKITVGWLAEWSSFMLVVVTAILAIFTGSMVFYIKKTFVVQDLGWFKNTDLSSYQATKNIQRELSSDKDLVNLISVIADANVSKKYDMDLSEYDTEILQMLNSLEELAMLENEFIASIDHIMPLFGVILINISNMKYIENLIDNYEIRGSKVYVHLPKLIYDIKS